MSQGDVRFIVYDVDTNVYGISTITMQAAAAFPPAIWEILGTGVVPATGTGGKGITLGIIFAIEK